MIKLKKIVAVALAATMCLGLSMTAFAKRQDSVTEWASPNYMQNSIAQGGQDGNGFLGQVARQNAWVGEITDKNGVSLEWSAGQLTEQQLKGINSEKKVRDLFEKAGYEVDDDWDLVPVLATAVRLDDGIGSDGAYAWIDLHELAQNGAAGQFGAGDVVPVLRETYAGSGTYELVMVEMVERNGQLEGRIQVTSNGQALVVVRVMENGTTVRLTNTKTGQSVYVDKNQSGTSTNAAASSSPSTSPKTGEF